MFFIKARFQEVLPSSNQSDHVYPCSMNHCIKSVVFLSIKGFFLLHYARELTVAFLTPLA